MSPWHDKTVLITGGSSGLGWQLAQAWAERGARVVLVARNAQRLAEAANRLLPPSESPSAPPQVYTYAADLTSGDQVDGLRNWFVEHFDHLDVLVNCAGQSDRGTIESTAPERFEELWQLNFMTALRCTQNFLPQLKKSRGSLVIIGSLAAKIAAPYLGAYPASKFPLAAVSQQLRLELKDAVHVLFVCPGPIQRDDAGQRYRSQVDDLPSAAGQPGGGAKIKPLCASRLAELIIRGCERRKPELVLPGKARLLSAIQQLSARWGDWLLRQSTP